MAYPLFKNRLDAAAAMAADESAATASAVVGSLEEDAGPADDAPPPPDPIACASPAQFALNSYDYWLAHASQLLRTYIKLVPEVSTVSGVAAIANQCTEKGIEGKSCVLIMYDSDLQGESHNRPADRKPPFDEEAFKTMMHGIMQGRGGQHNEQGKCTKMVPGDVIMLSNGGRNLDTCFAAPFLDTLGTHVPLTTVHSKDMTVTISEESLRARKSRVKGDIQQVQKLTFLTANNFNDAVPERGHSKYDGTNRGDAFGFVVIPPIADAWTLNFEAKKSIYGCRLVTTGTVDKDPRSRLRGDLPEPVFFNGWPSSFYENMFTVVSACAVIDCTAGPGDAAKAAMLAKLPYVGICLTSEHVTALTRHLVDWVLNAFKTEGHFLYRSTFAEVRQKNAATPKKPAGWVSVEDTAAKPKNKRRMDTRRKKVNVEGDSGKKPPKKVKDTAAKQASSESDSSDT